jgi:beta-lactamase regulating signal transducer with metallopeptidase domain
MIPDSLAVPLVTILAELSLIAKATLILGTGLVAARVARHARAAVRHLILAATFASLLALPIAARTAFPIRVPILTVAAAPHGAGHESVAAAGLAAPGATVPSAASATRAWVAALPWTSLVGAIWLLGALACLAPVVASTGRHRRWRRSGERDPTMGPAVRVLAADAGVKRVIDLLFHEDVRSPLTFGLRRPVIVLPLDARDWPDDDVRRALVHEIEHVRRADAATYGLTRAVAAVWWFHPLVWAAKRRLDLEAERACDDAVVMKEEHMAYAEQLVSLARRLSADSAHPALGMAGRTDLSTRVSALLDGRQRRGRAGAAAAVVTTVAATLILAGLAPMRVVAAAAPSSPSLAAAPLDGAPQSRRQRGLDRELYAAAEEGDLDGVVELINAGANVNAAIDGDGSALIAAARRGRLDVARVLLDRGADPNLAVPGDGSALIAAAAAGRADLATLLLDRGAKVDQVVESDENPLIQASGAGHLEVVRLLVTRGANVNARVRVLNYRDQEEWRTPLRQARLGGHDAVVKFLIAAGARD